LQALSTQTERVLFQRETKPRVERAITFSLISLKGAQTRLQQIKTASFTRMHTMPTALPTPHRITVAFITTVQRSAQGGKFLHWIVVSSAIDQRFQTLIVVLRDETLLQDLLRSEESDVSREPRTCQRPGLKVIF
jgi:hypothetical protein